MTIFDLPQWPLLKRFARLSTGRDNLDFIQLPNDLRTAVMDIVLPCVACGEPCHVFRARMKSGRSRIANQIEEHRLFFASTCPASVNAGCSRSKAAKDNKKVIRGLLGQQREPVKTIHVQLLDASGTVMYQLQSEVKEAFKIEIPSEATTIEFLPS